MHTKLLVLNLYSIHINNLFVYLTNNDINNYMLCIFNYLFKVINKTLQKKTNLLFWSTGFFLHDFENEFYSIEL